MLLPWKMQVHSGKVKYNVLRDNIKVWIWLLCHYLSICELKATSHESLGKHPLFSIISNELHYIDVVMGTMASQITSLTIVYSTVYAGADQRNHQSSAALAFVRGIHRGTGEFPAQMASNAESVSIWWRHHGKLLGLPVFCQTRAQRMYTETYSKSKWCVLWIHCP